MKGIFGLIFCGCAATAIWAHPAASGASDVVKNGDGYVTVITYGDEHYHYATTLDGFLIVTDGERYVYANGNGEPTDVLARDADSRTQSEKDFLEQLGESGKASSFVKHKERTEGRFPDADEQPGALLLRSVENRPSPPSWVSGVRHVPVLLIGTTDVPYADSAAVYDLLNKEGYNLDGALGSLRDYYLYSSSGKLDLNFDVYPLQLNVPQTSFGTGSSYSEGNYTKAGLDALVKHPDFARNAPKYCFSGTTVDGFVFLFPGKEVDALKQSSSFWGHKYQMTYNGSVSSFSKGYTAGGYTFDTYLFIAQKHDKFSDRLNALGIFAHEFSHVLGLKDLYSTVNGTTISGPKPYDVMTQGMYNGPTNVWQTPPAFSAFERSWMGWMEYRELEADSVYTLRDLSQMEAFTVSNPEHNDEFYVVEYRPAVMYDSYIGSNGVYVWYIDYDYSAFNDNAINSNVNHPRVAMKKVLSKDGCYVDFGFSNGSAAAKISGLYNFVLEKDTLACFATNSATKLSRCPVSLTLSSSSEESSSSAILPESSSAEILSSSSTMGFARSSVPAAGRNVRRQIVVFDLLGNRLLTADFNGSDYRKHLENLGRNAYMIRIFENGRLTVQKTVKKSSR